MIYSTAASFRRALEDRLKNISNQSQVPLIRLRKMVAFDRFIARLLNIGLQNWVLKGGFALELRLWQRARTTKDMDLLISVDPKFINEILVKAAKSEIGDYFSFTINNPSAIETDTFGGIRFEVLAFLDNRIFEQFHIDVGVQDVLIEPPEKVGIPPLLEFADIKPTEVPCYPIPQQIAEKYHALTRPFHSGDSSRVKDLIDILLMASIAPISCAKLRQSIKVTFEHRKSHPLPEKTHSVSPTFIRSFSNLADQVGLKQQTLEDANKALDEFLSPVISGSSVKTWNPERWAWE
jgi:hypothetical protein